MNNKSNQVKYGLIAKTYHWGFVVLFVYGIFKQVQDIEQLGDNSLLRFELIFALIFIALLTIRFFYMKKTQQSSLPEDTPKIQKMAARIVHNSMYICLFLVSIQAIYWLIGIHISAAIFHRIRKDGVWSSMVPFVKEK